MDRLPTGGRLDVSGRRSAMVAGHPWTLLLTLEEEQDTLGCWVAVQALNLDGNTADAWERYFPHLTDALRTLEMSYGISPGDWSLSE